MFLCIYGRMRNLMILMIAFISWSKHTLAYPVYLRQVIYNQTPFELYFGMRPYYQYPNWSCQGPISAYSMKICHDQYDNENDYFLLQIIKSFPPAKLDQSIGLKIPSLLYATSAEIVWNLKYDSWGNNFHFNYQVR